ncbi:MAG: response regulator, partial [Ignavibacteria bacterium]|nr:response regulator [Ignavibacteria bacterium]
MESILIVDDDISLCMALKDELLEVGYSVDYVNSGDDAFHYLSGNTVDLLLLDLKMPGKDGFDVLRGLTEQSIKSKIIVLTAYADVKSAIDSAR